MKTIPVRHSHFLFPSDWIASCFAVIVLDCIILKTFQLCLPAMAKILVEQMAEL